MFTRICIFEKRNVNNDAEKRIKLPNKITKGLAAGPFVSLTEKTETVDKIQIEMLQVLVNPWIVCLYEGIIHQL